jgi:type IV fimbrial biogenesis protein FimT
MYTHTKLAGFTIIELMITLVVAAILLAVAAPSFRDIIQNNRLTTEINTLSASLNLTRSEAIKRGSPVTLCKSNDFDASPSCVSAANWHDGWIVFDDIDSDGALDAGETIIRVVNGLTSGTTLVFATGKNDVIYTANGFAVGDNGTFRLCDGRGINFAKGLVISNSGRVRSASATELQSAGCS